MKIKQYMKKNGLLAALTISVDILAFVWWQSYLASGQVYDGKYRITFVGSGAVGHLVGITLMAVVLTYYLLKSILKADDQSDV